MKSPFLYFLIALLIFFLFILGVAFMRTDQIALESYDLLKDGVCRFPTAIDPITCQEIKNLCNKKEYKRVKRLLHHHPRLNQLIREKAGPDYIFQDYIWIIQKSSVHTCHRDNNGDFFNENQKHPSYTMLVYMENMEKCLGVVPGSHKEPGSYGVNARDPVFNILCQPGDAILFNANLIHVGTINDRDDHLRIQMKVSHRDDLEALSYYQNFNKIANADNVIPKKVLSVQKNISCMFPFISDMSQGENIKTARGTSDGAEIGVFQKMFSLFFYGNLDFYDLPDAL
jgi:hypothetical protein